MDTKSDEVIQTMYQRLIDLNNAIHDLAARYRDAVDQALKAEEVIHNISKRIEQIEAINEHHD